jgi:hypothetical protein
MSTKYKLAIAAFLLVPIAFTLADGDKETTFAFKLQAKRLSEQEWRDRFKDVEGTPTSDQLKSAMFEITTGWRDQTLVLDDTGAPATFSTDALEALFGAAPGVFDMYLSAYLKEVQAKVKN